MLFTVKFFRVVNGEMLSFFETKPKYAMPEKDIGIFGPSDEVLDLGKLYSKYFNFMEPDKVQLK